MRALLRLSSDITTKARGTRSRFVRRTAENLRRGLEAAGIRARVEPSYVRIRMDYEDPLALAVARRTFGVLSVSPCHEEPVADLETLVAHAHERMHERVAGRTFAVRARVRDETVGFRSNDVNVALGAALARHGKVRLDNPDVTVRIEVRDGRIQLFTDVLAAEGGIPVGEGGRAVALMSGGFDSAVAAWLTMRRGIALDFVCCRLGGEAHAQSVAAVANHLSVQWAAGLRSRLVVVPFEETVEALRRHVPPRYWQLVLKRAMYRTAEVLAVRRHADAIVTGEALGQVSSQTLRNLRALEHAAVLPVLRPVLTSDKNEILALARHIGTEALSSRVPEYCGLGASKPATAASVSALATAEAALPFDPNAVLADLPFLPLPTGGDRGAEAIETSEVPPGARVLDLRSPPAQRRHPIEGAVAIDPLDVLEHPETLDGTVPYVVVCDVGARSAWFARRLRELGLRASSLRQDLLEERGRQAARSIPGGRP